MKRKAKPRELWICDYCWNAFSTKRAALSMDHNGAIHTIEGLDYVTAFKVREVLTPKRKERAK